MAMFLDLSKSFDILLKNLFNFDILLTNYFFKRKFVVIVDEYESTEKYTNFNRCSAR